MQGQRGKRVHLERLEDVPEALQQDDLQRDLRQLLRRFCGDGLERGAAGGAQAREATQHSAPSLSAERPAQPAPHTAPG